MGSSPFFGSNDVGRGSNTVVQVYFFSFEGKTRENRFEGTLAAPTEHSSRGIMAANGPEEKRQAAGRGVRSTLPDILQIYHGVFDSSFPPFFCHI